MAASTAEICRGVSSTHSGRSLNLPAACDSAAPPLAGGCHVQELVHAALSDGQGAAVRHRGMRIAEEVVADADNLTKQRLLPDDGSVLRAVGGGGDGADQLGEVGDAADFFQQV